MSRYAVPATRRHWKKKKQGKKHRLSKNPSNKFGRFKNYAYLCTRFRKIAQKRSIR
jgi:hypothetical protein